MSESRLSIFKVIGGIRIVLLRLNWGTIRAAVEGAKLLSTDLLERVRGASSPRQRRPLALPATTAAVSAYRNRRARTERRVFPIAASEMGLWR
jgi:hypothetical protein